MIGMRFDSALPKENSRLPLPRLVNLRDWTQNASRQLVRALVYRFALSDADLQEKLGPLFPIRMQKYLITVTLLDPQVELHELHNRIGIRVAIDIILPGGIRTHGHIRTDSHLVYSRAEGAFYLDAPNISALEIHPLPGIYLKPVRFMIGSMLKRFFREHPVYRFRGNSLRHRLARGVFKDFEIKRGKLRVNFHLRRPTRGNDKLPAREPRMNHE